MTLILELLGGLTEVQRGRFTLCHIGGLLPHQVDQALLQRRSLLEASPRTTRHSRMNEGGERGVVAGNAHCLQVVERFPHLFGSETRYGHQLIGGYALVRIRLKQRLADGQQLFPVLIRDIRPRQPRLSFVG